PPCVARRAGGRRRALTGRGGGGHRRARAARRQPRQERPHPHERHRRGSPRLLRSHQGRLRRRLPIFVKDLCKDHAGGPLNNMGGSYKFMVKHVQLWKLPFHGTSPRWSDSDYTALRCYLY
uniref:Diacylglycerol glucosyltransferase N-terminal domain-containing protein n=1 Tax=Triticum urartu TaxID=4572 RepID=A0A8R7PDC3_TRIUA